MCRRPLWRLLVEAFLAQQYVCSSQGANLVYGSQLVVRSKECRPPHSCLRIFFWILLRVVCFCVSDSRRFVGLAQPSSWPLCHHDIGDLEIQLECFFASLLAILLFPSIVDRKGHLPVLTEILLHDPWMFLVKSISGHVCLKCINLE